LTAKVLNEFKQQVKEWTLIPAGGGAFEVTLDGDLVYSKLKTGEFPKEDWVLETVRKRLN
jgi:selenoprotein W-related protein